jgi:hypothetical protein
VNKKHMPLGRYVSVENSSIDGLGSVLDVGLLVFLLRQPPGADMTIDRIAREYREGRKALSDSMKRLVAAGHVVKLRIQSSVTNRWWTDVTVAHRPFTSKQVAELIEGIQDVRNFRVEPARLDPRREMYSTAPGNVVALRSVR